MTDLRLKVPATTVQRGAYLVPSRPGAKPTHLALVGLGTYVASLGPLNVSAWEGGTDVSGGIVALALNNLEYRAEPPADLLDRVDREEAWFNAHRAELAPTYGGRYVAIHGGRVVDADGDLAALVDRFFKGRVVAPGYFGFVGDEPASALAAAPRAIS